MQTLPEDEIHEDSARSRRDGENCRSVVRLGDPGGGDTVYAEPEPELVLAGDAVTVVLPARERVRRVGRPRAPHVAAVTLAVLGAGVSIRLLRRPSGRGGVRSEATTRHFAAAPSAPRERGAARSAHYRIETAARQRAEGQRRAVHRGVGGERRARTSLPATSVPARVRPVPATPAAGYAPQDGAGPAVDDGSAPVRSEQQSPPAPRRRPPCLPGTLGC
jgi:hypothetical protein